VASLEERFWAKVQKTDTCWLWTAATTTPMKRSPHILYGLIGLGSRKAGTIRAHKLSYIWAKGPIPEGQVVRHTCDNTLCVRPSHLILGTQADNVRDMAERGRVRNQNMDKTTCVNGHSLDDALEYERSDKHEFGKPTRRRCRECSRLSCIAYRERKKAARV
jgi:hypothetical protein